ncbi:MAG: heme o synthase [Halobacteriovoraceae bacterium]|nr:heme o synthase [Halobacteriovoraceae bacterium]
MTHARTYSLLTILFSFGLLMPGVGHPILGLIVGVLTLVVAFRSATPLAFFALILVGVQGMIGGLQAPADVAPLLSVTHFSLSLLFMTLIILIDFRLNEFKYEVSSVHSSVLERGFHFSDGLGLLAFLSFCQLILGSFTRNTLVIENAVLSLNDLKVLSHFLGMFIGFFGLYWLSKMSALLEETHPLQKVCLFFLTVFAALSTAQLFFPLEGKMEVICIVTGMASFVGLWRTNLYMRGLEKQVLKDKRFSFWSDLLDLTKPRLGLLVMSTVFVGMMLAPRPLNLFTGLAGFSYTFLLVMGAAAFNCWMEIDVDALMDRTKNRPLPTGRLKPKVALVYSSGLMIVALIGLYTYVNTLTAVLGFIAAVLYVFVYTPLKQKSVLALYVGAIPGALPPLMGWTIVMGQMTHMGWVLFWILFVWQLPHFLAISIYHAKDYQKADIKIYPNSFGLRLTKWGIFTLTVVLAAVSLYPWFKNLGVSDRFGYFALFINIVFTLVSLRVFLTPTENEILLRRWARIYFLGSIIYLPLLLGSMIYLN